jgi:redox-sensitive bicupin YhaK (pirin superfamily)
MGFGLLRVINDDMVAPAGGFPTHPHRNMEIISIPLAGSLGHEDSMGNKHVIHAGEIQLMSAGTGVTHSEYNNSDSEKVNFLQIWVMPKKMNIEPRYEQKEINKEEVHNNFKLIIAPLGTDSVVGINQDAYFSIAKIDAGKNINYIKHNNNNGIYVFVIGGNINIGTQELSKRDGIGISEEDSLEMKAHELSEVLCIEVPMQ